MQTSIRERAAVERAGMAAREPRRIINPLLGMSPDFLKKPLNSEQEHAIRRAMEAMAEAGEYIDSAVKSLGGFPIDLGPLKAAEAFIGVQEKGGALYCLAVVLNQSASLRRRAAQ